MGRKSLCIILYMTTVIAASLMLSGCGLIPSLNLTEEQSTLIAEFAAGKLVEYVKGHPGGLMNLEDVDRSEVNPGLKKEEEQPDELPPLLPGSTDSPAPAPPDEIVPNDEEQFVPESTGDEALVEAPEVDAPPAKSLAEALGIEGADLKYDHYEVVSTYPDNTELAFTMKAAPGKELLIVHFVLSNPGSSDINAFTDSSNFKVRMMVNGSDKIRGDVTFLDNDLMNYQGLLTPGAQVDSVLVFEVKEGTAISSMDLLILEDDNENKYPLM